MSYYCPLSYPCSPRSLVEYPIVTYLNCTSVVIAVESAARNDVAVKLYNPAGNANQVCLALQTLISFNTFTPS